MENLKTLLVANRGEIANRIIRTAKRLGIRTISIYTPADAASLHVGAADEAVLLSGPDSKAYLDGDQIIEIAKSRNVDVIIPGYGFLSENTEFARQIADAGMVFAGPSPKAIDDFGIKHTARELAAAADLPIVPGTKGLVQSQENAVAEANALGYPVMLKATAGGGGMGLLTCDTEEDVRKSFKTVQSRGETLFKNAGLFIEKFYPNSHHIEVQVFGNGQGKQRISYEVVRGLLNLDFIPCSLDSRTVEYITDIEKERLYTSASENVPFNADIKRSSKNVPVRSWLKNLD